MITADTSVIVAGFASWHESHAVAHKELQQVSQLIGHCALETYSVLSRLPAPHRSPPHIVSQFITTRFSQDFMLLDSAGICRLLATLPSGGIAGGATYDAVIGATAAFFGVTLLSLDRRAIQTYETCGATVRLLG